jgi:hypothetical protein
MVGPQLQLLRLHRKTSRMGHAHQLAQAANLTQLLLKLRALLGGVEESLGRLWKTQPICAKMSL